ncbi:MAG: shikimate dehydrogenase [Sulfurimonas sp.]|nr:MAG: shikimate dehydrogenase [Sulfurimonas sp.]
MKLFAIFGDPVAHSRSPLMHNCVFTHLGVHACYTRIHLKESAQLKATFFALQLSGANVTVPHKEAAFEACDEVRGFAKSIGVVNTLVNENGRLIGYNTDADGFMYAMAPFQPIKSVLVLGAGGTAKALVNKFVDEGMHVSVLNRSKGRLDYFTSLGVATYTWDTMPQQQFDLIVNTTSAGLSGHEYPAPVALLEPLIAVCHFCADAIYGKVTPFLHLAQQYRKISKDGADMLLGQGVLACALFLDHQFDNKQIETQMKKSFLL